ncbi:MAG: hypothetical protein U0136_15705 [Bdellovibrionota bacterium]
MYKTSSSLPSSLGRSVVSAETLPEFSSSRSDTRFGDLFYAFLQTNERSTELENSEPEIPPSSPGSYIGIGLGVSLYLLERYFAPRMHSIFLCEREPYVYFMTKLALRMFRTVDSPEELFLLFLDHDSFDTIFRLEIANEPDESPLFLRASREEMLSQAPEAFLRLRQGLFSTRHHKLTQRERALFHPESTAEIDEKIAWVRHFLRYKADYVKALVIRRFDFFRTLFSENPVHSLCVDIFHPDLWESLSAAPLWNDPAMIYLSNAAVYSNGENIRKDEFSTSSRYTTELFAEIPGINERRHRFAYSIKSEQYELRCADHIPSEDELLDSFRPKKRISTLPPLEVVPEKKVIEPPPPPPRTGEVFRLQRGGRRGTRA